MKNIISIIPARGGSKNIPKKNIKPFLNHPLIHWTIQQSLNTPEISDTYVTSDSKEILNIAATSGAKIIKRPKKLSKDTSSTESAINHAIETLSKKPDLIVLLQPTSPLRKPTDISNAINTLLNNHYDSLFTATKLEDFLIWKKNGNKFQSVNYDYTNRSRRQDRTPEYVENGSIYIFKSELIKTLNNRIGGNFGVSLMEFWQSFELDQTEEWALFETLYQHFIFNKQNNQNKKNQL